MPQEIVTREVVTKTPQNELQKANRKLTVQLSVFALGSLAFVIVLVSFYDTLCDITGYGSKKSLTQAATVASTAVTTREVTVEFISSAPTFGEWEFRPVVTSLKVKTGQLNEAKFIAKNLLAHAVTGQAVPDIAPRQVAKYFHKVECFCFTPQQFAANQERELTVRFIVDANIPDDVDRLTLGYALYGVEPTTKVATR